MPNSEVVQNGLFWARFRKYVTASQNRIYKAAKKVYSFLDLLWKTASFEGDGMATIPRTQKAYYEPHYHNCFGPEHQAGNLSYAGVSGLVIGGQFLRRLLDYQTDEKRKKSFYLYEIIDAYAGYLVNHSHLPLTRHLSIEDKLRKKIELRKQIYDALFNENKLNELAKKLFPKEKYKNYRIEITDIDYRADDPRLNTKKKFWYEKKEGLEWDYYTKKRILLIADKQPKGKKNDKEYQRLLSDSDNESEQDPTLSTSSDSLLCNVDIKKHNWFEKLFQKTMKSTPAKWVFLAWDFITQYTIYYWLGWLYTLMFTGIDIAQNSLTIGLTFGLPLIIPVFNLIWKGAHQVYAWFTKNENINLKVNNKSKRNLELDRRQLIAARLLEIHYNQLSDELAQQTDQLNLLKANFNIKDLPNPQSRTLSPIENETKELPRKASRLQGLWRWTKWWKEILNTRPAKIIMGFLTGAMFGYIMTYFASWPVQYFLESVFHIAAATTFWPVLIVSIVSATMGLWMGIKRSTEASIQCKENHNEVVNRQKALKECKSLKNKNKQLRKLVAEQYNELQQINTKNIPGLARQDLSPRIAEERLDKNTQFWETMNIQAKDTFVRKALRVMDAAFVWLFCGFSGSLLIRSLFSGGAVLTFFYPPLAPALFASLGLGLVALWGTYKLVEYLVNKQQAADLQYVKQAKTYSVGLEQENQYLEKLASNQKEALQVYSHQALQSLAPYSSSRENKLTIFDDYHEKHASTFSSNSKAVKQPVCISSSSIKCPKVAGR